MSHVRPVGASSVGENFSLFNFGDLDLGWGSQGQCKAKPVGFIISHNFQLIVMEYDMVLRQFKVNTLTPFLSEI